MKNDKAVVTCALTGVLTNPKQHPVPVTPEEMAIAAEQAYNAGATIVHCHFRDQRPGFGHLPTWDPDIVDNIVSAIRDRVPNIIINASTGTPGSDISGPLACIERVKPEMAALNFGSINYLKIKENGDWAWPPLLFDNPVEKIEKFTAVMKKNNVVPECECFDTGMVRSVKLFQTRGEIDSPAHISLVMGVQSGMPADAKWLPFLIDEMNPETYWQTIAVGRHAIWELQRKAAELGGDLRTGLEDSFYLPNGAKAENNGKLVESLVRIIRETGREIASPSETKERLLYK